MTPEELRAICETVGSQAEVARLTKLDRQHLNKLVRGLYKITPATANLIKLATHKHRRNDHKTVDKE